MHGWVVYMHMLHWRMAAKLLQQLMYDTHSQYHKPWFAAEQSGTIICAHCTCMAGSGYRGWETIEMANQ